MVVVASAALVTQWVASESGEEQGRRVEDMHENRLITPNSFPDVRLDG